MRTVILFFTFIGLLSISCAQNKDAYNIRIKINNTSDKELLLVNYYGDKQYIKDTARYDSKGWAVFRGKEALDPGIYIAVMESRKYFEFMVDKEQIFTLETDTTDLVMNMKVKGSNDNLMFYEYLKLLNQKSKEREALEKQKETAESPEEIDILIKQINKDIIAYKEEVINNKPASFTAAIFKASREPEIPTELPKLENGKTDSAYGYFYFRNHYWDGFDFTDERLVRSPVYFNKLKTYFTQVLLQHPDTLIKEAQWLIPRTEPNKEMFKFTVWYLTYTSETSGIMGIDAFFVYMVDNYYRTGKAFWINESVMEKITSRATTLKSLLLGKTAPDLQMTDSNLVFKPLHKVNSKYTIIYFWDYSCGHCKKETPVLLDFYNKNKNIVSVYAVGMIEDFEKWKAYIRENNLNWINVVDAYNKTNFRKIYDLSSTPIIFLLDKDKKILAKKISAEQTIDFIERKEKEESN